MRLYLRSLLLCSLAFSVVAAAQTYKPKAIRIEGAGDDAPELLKSIGLKQGEPITKEQIEEALGKLSEAGSFTDISYTVNETALVIKVTAPSSSHVHPVRFDNFVWWQPAELEKLLEARLPLYHGQLAEHGSLTDEVQKALVALAQEKGITANVSAVFESQANALVFQIDKPAILFGDLQLDDIKPVVGPSTLDLKRGIKGQEFSLIHTPGTIMGDATDIYRNAGYLDVTVDRPIFSAPRASGSGFAIDGSAAVHRGEQYHVRDLDLSAVPSLKDADLRKVIELKAGNPASPMAAKLSNAQIEREYKDAGYLAASVERTDSEDKAAHTVSYRFSATPGELFHVAAINAGSLAPNLQAALAKESRLQPGVVAGKQVRQAIFETLHRFDAEKTVNMSLSTDAAQHTATYMLTPKK